jgi:dimethylamine monooxygenase subunit A
MTLPLPFLDGPFRLAMGLARVPEKAWIERDESTAARLRDRARLLDHRRDEVLQAWPGSEAGQAEVLDLLADHLPRALPENYARRGRFMHERATGLGIDLEDPAMPPLERAGRLVEEDLCLLERRDGVFRLTAACLCFPAHWRLADKLGRGLDAIHEPVPGYEAIASQVDRLLARLKPDRVMARANWSLVETPRLFHPEPRVPPVGLTALDVGRLLWLRVERQTLRRLPATGGVLFTIRTLVRRLDEVVADPAIAAALAARIRELPEDLAAYKGLPPIRDALLADLDQKAGLAADG